MLKMRMRHIALSADMNPLLREIVQRKALGKFIGDGYIRVNKLEEGKYTLAAKVRGNGGGLAFWCDRGWISRAVGYGLYGYSYSNRRRNCYCMPLK